MILFEQKKSIAIITLNRPKAYNSFVREMALELQSKLEICKTDNDIRCIVITGSGKAFCAGQDLNEAIDPKKSNIEEIVNHHYNPIIKKIRKMEKPIIAAVNGVAAGAGAKGKNNDGKQVQKDAKQEELTNIRKIWKIKM